MAEETGQREPALSAAVLAGALDGLGDRINDLRGDFTFALLEQNSKLVRRIERLEEVVAAHLAPEFVPEFVGPRLFDLEQLGS